MKRHWIGLVLWLWLFHAWFGFRVYGLGFGFGFSTRGLGLGFRVYGLGFGFGFSTRGLVQMLLGAHILSRKFVLLAICSSWRGLLCPQTPNLTRIFSSQMEEGVGEIVESAFA